MRGEIRRVGEREFALVELVDAGLRLLPPRRQQAVAGVEI